VVRGCAADCSGAVVTLRRPARPAPSEMTWYVLPQLEDPIHLRGARDVVADSQRPSSARANIVCFAVPLASDHHGPCKSARTLCVIPASVQNKQSTTLRYEIKDDLIAILTSR
jgi:hypothetical protein